MNCLPLISEAEYEVMKVVWKESPVNTNGCDGNIELNNELESENPFRHC